MLCLACFCVFCVFCLWSASRSSVCQSHGLNVASVQVREMSIVSLRRFVRIARCAQFFRGGGIFFHSVGWALASSSTAVLFFSGAAVWVLCRKQR